MADSETVLKTFTDVAYGSAVMYDDEDEYAFPEKTDEESNYIYNVFNGWDKSTSYITGDTDVHAQWIRGALPADGSTPLDQLNYAQISAVSRNGLASTYFEDGDHFNCVLGHDFNYENVESETLVATPIFLDGTGTNLIDTDIKLFDADSPSFTMAIDYEFVNSPVNSVMAACFDENGNEGFRLRYSSYPNVQWGDTNQNVGYGSQRAILTLRHVKGSSDLYIGYNNEGNLIYNGTIVEQKFIRSRMSGTDMTLVLGGQKYGDNDYDDFARGWIHWCKIWYQDLGERDAKALASWPHEEIRFDYTGLTYRLSGSGRAGMGFVAHYPTALTKRMNPTSTNVGGWDESEMRTFLNDQMFAAMPTPLQALIVSVRVLASEGNRSTNITTSIDKIYLLAIAEVTNQTDATYLAEGGTRISYFSTNESRLGVPGISIEDDAEVYSGTVDPTTNTDYTVTNGFLWIKTNSSSNGYVYRDADWCSKHAVAGGRLLTSTDNIAAAGSQGGYWIRTAGWWLRSPYLAATSGFWIVYASGDSGYASANSTYGVVPAFSIG